jgi:hypothetical protein
MRMKGHPYLGFFLTLTLFSCNKEKGKISINSTNVSPILEFSQGGIHLPKFVQKPNSNCPNCGWFCNPRQSGDCLPEVVVIGQINFVQYTSFTDSIKGERSIQEFLNDSDFIALMQFDKMDEYLSNGLIDRHFKLFFTNNVDEGLEYVSVVDSFFSISESNLELGAYFTIQVLLE